MLMFFSETLSSCLQCMRRFAKIAHSPAYCDTPFIAHARIHDSKRPDNNLQLHRTTGTRWNQFHLIPLNGVCYFNSPADARLFSISVILLCGNDVMRTKSRDTCCSPFSGHNLLTSLHNKNQALFINDTVYTLSLVPILHVISSYCLH